MATDVPRKCFRILCVSGELCCGFLSPQQQTATHSLDGAVACRHVGDEFAVILPNVVNCITYLLCHIRGEPLVFKRSPAAGNPKPSFRFGLPHSAD